MCSLQSQLPCDVVSQTRRYRNDPIIMIKYLSKITIYVYRRVQGIPLVCSLVSQVSMQYVLLALVQVQYALYIP